MTVSFLPYSRRLDSAPSPSYLLGMPVHSWASTFKGKTDLGELLISVKEGGVGSGDIGMP